MKVEIKINNMPEEIHHPYIVVRRIKDTTLWYWGQYKSKTEAEQWAVRIGNGFVVEAVDHDLVSI